MSTNEPASELALLKEEIENLRETAEAASIECQVMGTILNRTIMAVVANHPQRDALTDVIFRASEDALHRMEAAGDVPLAAQKYRACLERLRGGLPQ